MFEGAYAAGLDIERPKRPGLPITVLIVNKCLMAAWSHLKAKGGPAIVKGFKVTGIHPLDRNAENHVKARHRAKLFEAKGKQQESTAVRMKRPTDVYSDQPNKLMRYAGSGSALG
jgi:hypothetical protein